MPFLTEPLVCLEPVEFDSAAFGFPYYRVTRLEEDGLAAEVDALLRNGRMAADAKRPADDVAGTHALMKLGFRKVCMQVTLQWRTAGSPEPDPEVELRDSLGVDEETLWRHARNFTRDRFSMDPLLPAAGRHRLYFQWLRNSVSGSKRVARAGDNLCTFSRKGGDVVIDLVSILEARRGIGTRLLRTLQAHAVATGAESIIVSTECENTPAWSLYQKMGFLPIRYTSALHLVQR